MHQNLSITVLALSLLTLAVTGCAAPPAERMSGVVGSPGQASVAGPASRRDAANSQSDANATRLPAPVQADAQAALRVADAAYARSDWVLAAREFKALTAVYPRNGQVWFGLGAASALSGNLDEASLAFEAALRIDPRDARAAYNLSLIRLSQAEIALGTASANAAMAAGPVQLEINRLSRELGPVFNRSAEIKAVVAAPPTATASASFRMQDPARGPGAAAALSMTGAYSAIPIIPSAALVR